MAGPQRAAVEQRGPRLRKASGGELEAVRIWLLGGFRVSVGDRIIEEKGWRRRKAASLIKVLALASPHHRLHRERVMELLWPDLDSEEAATDNLYRTLHFARRTLEPQAPNAAVSRYMHLGGDLLALCPSTPLWVDVEAFEGTAATARRTREPAAYRAAIELYAGELLPEDRFEDWAVGRREELLRTYLALLLEMAGLHEERGEYGPAIEALGRVVANEPTREEAHAGLMRLYAISGQRHRALVQYEQLREALRRELESEPGAVSRRLHGEIMAERFPPSHPLPVRGRSPEDLPGAPRRHNLPSAPSSFVGRERALVEVKRLLSMTRLLTLTGTGGCGKTRLALEVATDLVGAYPDGVWLVELAALSEPELAPQAVASVLEVAEQPGRPLTATLVDALRSRQILIVLDNCEHLIDAASHLVDTLLNGCPRLRILATSREALGVAGETYWPVPSLVVPDAGDLSAAAAQDLTRYEAVGLFVERARSRLPSFVLTPENAGAVVEVCRRLEGMPLAIELATARVTVLAVEQVAARLEDSLKLLSAGGRGAVSRHQTLRGTLDWSHELLNEPERKLFGGLSAFAGGWTLEAAEAVGAGEGIEGDDVLDLLSRLVDKSLVLAGAEEGAFRYRMLEPIRQYGCERLEESGEAERVRERHAGYYLALAERAEPELIGAGQAAWLEQLETEYGNLWAALSWCLDDEGAKKPEEHAEMGLRLAGALGRFWSTHGSSEGRRWLEKGLAKSFASPTSVRAKALVEAGFIAVYQGDPRSLALLEEGLALYKELGDHSGAAIALGYLGHAVVHLDSRERITALREEAEALLEEPLDRRAAGHLLLLLGLVAMTESDHDQVAARIGESLALLRELGDLRGAAMGLTTVGMSALEQADARRAAELFEEDLRILRELKDKVGIVYGLLGMAAVAALGGHPVRAARLWGAAETLREAIGHPPLPLEQAHYYYEGHLAAARARLEEAAFNAAWSEGRAMSPEQAIEYGLLKEEEHDAPTALVSVPEQPPAGEPAATLTRRQREVAALVSLGLTNRQVAKELSISEHTAATHVREILKKLGLRSRTQIAAWLTEEQPLP